MEVDLSWYELLYLDFLLDPESKYTGEMYKEILADQANLLMQAFFSEGDLIFQDDNVPIHAAGNVQSQFDEHERSPFNTESISATGISLKTFTLISKNNTSTSTIFSKHYFLLTWMNRLLANS